MADYTVSTNLISWIPAMHGVFGWPDSGHEAEVVRGMNVGDWLVPKFAQGPTAQDQEDYQREIAAVMNDDLEARLTEYMDKVNGGGSSWGSGAVPFVMRVGTQRGDEDRWPSSESWACVNVEVIWLEHPLSTSEYLRLRVVPVTLAGQFKAMAAPNKHIQPLPDGAASTIHEAGGQAERGYDFLRREMLVRAETPEEAAAVLHEKGLGPDPLAAHWDPHDARVRCSACGRARLPLRSHRASARASRPHRSDRERPDRLADPLGGGPPSFDHPLHRL